MNETERRRAISEYRYCRCCGNSGWNMEYCGCGAAVGTERPRWELVSGNLDKRTWIAVKDGMTAEREEIWGGRCRYKVRRQDGTVKSAGICASVLEATIAAETSMGVEVGFY